MVVVGYNYPQFRGTEDTALSAGKKEIVVDKSEIKEMPEGKSSEEIDALMMEGEEVDKINQPDKVEEKEKTDLAEEALEATEEPSPAEESVETEAEEEKPAEEKPEVDPKDAVIGDFRRKNRDLEVDKARLEGELKARAELQQPTVEVEKSPLQIAMEAEGVDDPDELEKPFSVMQKQVKWEREQEKKATQEEKLESRNTSLAGTVESLQEEELSVEKMGEGLDLKSVSELGDKLLSRGDGVDIADVLAKKGTKAAVKKSYEILKRRILEAGGENAKLLKAAIAKKGKSQTEPEKKTDIDALTTEGEDKETGEAEPETHSRRITNFVFSED